MSSNKPDTLGSTYVVCLLALIIPSAQVAFADNQGTLLPTGGGSAYVDGLRITCGPGLIPFIAQENVTGEIDLPLGKVSFTGRPVHFGYCGYPVANNVPSMINISEQLNMREITSFAVNRSEMPLLCQYGELPFVLIGSADSFLPTNKGAVTLQGDENNIAVCIQSAKETILN
ncbi:hypothetical protein [Duganella qianjiadongensis]|uniref:DUF4280 domain-containing protein n=1 Tax=Duganella qianjiadongensis TaxID=2692176 RepID=A0ABW9VII8_9BURK|nr:hypothetical protein [Duganella qianjiadongensis]MYM39439.1 hypothetical protein [Duganella qianjiadongensis]